MTTAADRDDHLALHAVTAEMTAAGTIAEMIVIEETGMTACAIDDCGAASAAP